MAHCSYDVHVQEILGTLIGGGSIVLLRPRGNMDFEYLIKIIQQKQVSYMQSVPSYVDNLIDFLSHYNTPTLESLRTLDMGGK